MSEDNLLANELASRLLEHVGTGTPRSYRSRPDRIYKIDVEEDVELFAGELEFAGSSRTFLPCVPLGYHEPTPLLISSVLKLVLRKRELGQRTNLQDARRLIESTDWRKVIETTLPTLGLHPSFRPISTVLELFRERLVSFLTRRYSTKDDVDQGGGGLLFKVFTANIGLRIHYSPSYVLDFNKVFGAPSSPVKGLIRPGTYKFGAMGEGFPLKIDPADFDIPPLQEAQLEGI